MAVTEEGEGRIACTPKIFGGVVLARKDMQKASIGALCIASKHETNGLLLLRHGGLETDRR